MRSPVLFATLFSTAMLLTIVHVSAIVFHLYWLFPWLDLLAHMLGGIVIGLFYFALPLFFKKLPERYMDYMGLITFVIIIGLLWEIFEIKAGFPNFYAYEHYIKDLYVDLFMDVVGGSIAFFVGGRLKEL